MKQKEQIVYTICTIVFCSFGLLCLLIVLNGCSQCTHLETTCHGNRLETCNAAGRWELTVDCYDYGKEFVCLETFDEAGESEAVCIPEEYTR